MSGTPRRRRGARTALLAAAGVAGLAVAAAAAIGLGGRGPAEQPPAARTGTTVEIGRETLVESVSVAATLSYGATTPAEVKAAGTVTWLPPVGSTVVRGSAVARVDEKPVTVLYGTLPMYRPLAAPLEGPDVRQFEENLRALGYTGFTVDDRYTDSTVTAVKRWQRKLGLAETGTVQPAEVMLAGGPLRIATHSVRLGAAAPALVLEYTGSTRIVTAQVDAGGAAWAVRGAKVTVTLPDGSSVAGLVDRLAETAEPVAGGETGEPVRSTMEVVVTVADQKALGRLEKAPVEVRYVAQERPDVLTVPVGALVALAEGGYGLEVADGAAVRFVAVETGLFAGGRVEISGPDVRAGLTVRVPG